MQYIFALCYQQPLLFQLLTIKRAGDDDGLEWCWPLGSEIKRTFVVCSRYMMISYALIFIAIRLHVASSLVSNSWGSRRRHFSPYRAPLQSIPSITQKLTSSWTNNRIDIPKVVYGSSNIRLQSHDNIKNDIIIDDDDIPQNNDEEQTRRSFLSSSLISTSIIFGSSTIANARGLVRFPCKEPLLNTYHFMRCGLSELEIEDIWSTNPLFLTNREAALSELGDEQVREACRYIKEYASQPTVVRYSLAAASIDSANIVGDELKIGRDRLVPEFNYMDPRAIGGWDGSQLNATEEAVWAMDVDEGGPNGKGGKPPSNEDGTPAETLSNQVVRLTNLMSVLETLYSGDTILLVFPDGTGPALLSCLIGGIPLNRVHELQFNPGEVRANVDYTSINTLASRPPPQSYLDILQRGREELKELRENPELVRNVKDIEYEREREAEMKELEKKKEEAKAKQLELERKKKEKILQRQNQTKNEIDFGSLGIVGAGITGATVFASVTLGGNETETKEDLTDATSNTTDIGSATLNSTSTVVSTPSDEETLRVDDQPIEDEDDDIPSTFDDIINEEDVVKISSAAASETYEDDWLSSISDIMNEDDKDAFQ